MSPLPVHNARPAPIADRQLAQLRRVAHDARNGLTSEAEAEWLLSCAGPLLDELAQRRVLMADWPAQLDLSNVITLPAVR